MKKYRNNVDTRKPLLALLLAGTVVGVSYQTTTARADTTDDPAMTSEQTPTPTAETTSTVTLKATTAQPSQPTATAAPVVALQHKPTTATTPQSPARKDPTAVTPEQVVTTGRVAPGQVAKASPMRHERPRRATVTPMTLSQAIQAAKTTTRAAITASGKFGTVDWTMDDTGNLAFTSSGTFAGDKKYSQIQQLVPGPSIKTITFEQRVTLAPDSSMLFNQLTNLTEIIGLDQIDTSQVTSMRELFSQTGLLNLDLSHASWDTSHVTDMSAMFANNPALKTVDVTGFKTNRVTTMASMFTRDPQLTTIKGTTRTSGWDTSHVTSLFSMFGSDAALTSLDVSDWDTGQVSGTIGLNAVFKGAASLTSLDVSHWNVAAAAGMANMFQDMRSLTALDLSRWRFAPGALRQTTNAFYGASSLTELDLSQLDMSNAFVVNMLAETTSLAKLTLGPTNKLAETGLLEAPTIDPYTGKWLATTADKTYTAAELMATYTGAMADTYVWDQATTDPGDGDGNGGGTTDPGDGDGDGGGTVTPDPDPNPQPNPDPDPGTPTPPTAIKPTDPATGGQDATASGNRPGVAKQTTTPTLKAAGMTRTAKADLPQTNDHRASVLQLVGLISLGLLAHRWFKRQEDR